MTTLAFAVGGVVLIPVPGEDGALRMSAKAATKLAMDLLAAVDAANGQSDHASGTVPEVQGKAAALRNNPRKAHAAARKYRTR